MMDRAGLIMVAGIDVGRRVGVAVIGINGDRPAVLRTARYEADLSDPASLKWIAAAVRRKVRGCGTVVMERAIPGGKSPSLAEAAELRGAILAGLAGLDVEIVRISPSSMKKQVTGYGMATKGEVRRAAESITGSDRIRDEHVADAVALALSYLASRGIIPVAPPVRKRKPTGRGMWVRRNDAFVHVRPPRRR